MQYASLGQLAAFVYGDAALTANLPADATRLLQRASEVIAEATMAAVYTTDTSGLPTDTGVSGAMANATCAQVEFWITGDEEDDISGPLESMSVGGQGQGYGSTNRVTPMYLAPRAARLLNIAGLLSGVVGGLNVETRVVK